MAKSSNEQWVDALLRHQVMLLRLSRTVGGRINALLDRSGEDLRDRIVSRMARAPEGPTPANLRRAQSLEKVIAQARRRDWKQVNAAWVEELYGLARREAAFLQSSLVLVSPVVVETALPSAQLLRTLVTARPFEGKTLRQWSASIERADIARIHDQIRIGMVQGEPAQTVARRVVGTVRARGADGVLDITRRQAEAISRTAIIHVSNQVRRAFAEENADIFSQEQYLSTLDGRTTPICASLDGKLFPVGEGPIPPLHFNCRSIRIPALDSDIMSGRPSSPFTERRLAREYAQEHGLDPTGSRADLPRGHKGAFDDWARERKRELIGQVPGRTTYQEWLGNQTVTFQDDVLGETKGRLFRDGGLTLDRFVDRAGNPYTLEQLAAREEAAFRAAGLSLAR